MRGLHKSKLMDELIKETEFLAANNTKELVIIAQDTTDYGKDIYGRQNLAELLNKLSDVKGIEWIRLMYAYPSKFPDDVIEEIRTNSKVLHYVDIPLQHISDDVLKSMRRGVTASRTRKLIEKLRSEIPDITLRTTFIVGYPNETEKDFEMLCDFVREAKFDRVGTFTFSVEENTSSFILGDPVSAEEKLRRRDTLMEIQREISLEKNSTFVDKVLKVLVEGVEGDFYIGRSYRDAPEVDGVILIKKNDFQLEPGNFYNIKITGFEEYDLFGTPIL